DGRIERGLAAGADGGGLVRRQHLAQTVGPFHPRLGEPATRPAEVAEVLDPEHQPRLRSAGGPLASSIAASKPSWNSSLLDEPGPRTRSARRSASAALTHTPITRITTAAYTQAARKRVSARLMTRPPARVSFRARE